MDYGRSMLRSCYCKASAVSAAKTGGGKAMIEERDNIVAMRDGTRLAVDVYRPDKPGKYPVLYAAAILSLGPYRYPAEEKISAGAGRVVDAPATERA